MKHTSLSREILIIGLICILIIGGLFFWVFQSFSFDTETQIYWEKQWMENTSRDVSRILWDDVFMLYSSLFEDMNFTVDSSLEDLSEMVDQRITRYREVSYDTSLIGNYAILQPKEGGEGFEYAAGDSALLEEMIGKFNDLERLPLPSARKMTIKVDQDQGLLIFSSPPFESEENDPHSNFVYILIRINTDYLYHIILPRAIEEAFGGKRDQYEIRVYRGGPISEGFKNKWDIVIPLITNTSYDSAFSLVANLMSRKDIEHIEFTESAEDWYLLLRRVEGSVETYVLDQRNQNIFLLGSMSGGLALLILLLILINFQTLRNAQRESEFISMISHELKTPLSAVRLSADNLKRGLITDPADVREYAVIIADEEKRLSKMIDNILILNRSRTGSKSFLEEWIDLEDFFKNIIEDFKHSQNLSDSIFSLQSEPGLYPVRGNKSALTAVIQNLIHNGLLYSTHTEIEKRLSIRLRNKKIGIRSGVSICFKDNGRGIPFKEIHEIFKPFRRGKEAQETQLPGSGLGLALSKNIAGDHKGHLKLIETGPGGTTFELWLPEAKHEI